MDCKALNVTRRERERGKYERVRGVSGQCRDQQGHLSLVYRETGINETRIKVKTTKTITI